MILRPVALLASLVFITYSAQDAYEPKERRVQKSAVGVDFTYHSHVDKASDNKFALNHFIKNNSSTPLSVEWKDAGIECVGTGQLPAGYKDTGISGVITESPALINSDILYGVKLNYHAPAQVYIDPQKTNAQANFLDQSNNQIVETTYERKNQQDEVVFSLKVISTLDKENQSAQLTFRIYGGLSLALVTDAPRESGSEILRGFREPLGESGFGFADKSLNSSLKKWFDIKERANVTRFLILKNDTNDEVEWSGTFSRDTGSESALVFALRKIRLVAYKANEDGFIGLTALVYIPSDLSLK
jgi:hypothetical protein